jgi:hypothetical protein
VESGGERPGPGAVWLLAAPAAPLPRAEAEAFLAHAEAGGLSVWALGPRRQPELERLLGATRLAGPGERTTAGIAGAGPLEGLVLRSGAAGVASTWPGARLATGPDAPPAALVLPAGRGEVLLLAGTELLDGARIGEADNLSLWVRLAARGPIAFDERWLRLVDATAPRLPWVAGGQALLAALLRLGALGRRHGAVRPAPGQAPRRTASDYLRGLASLSRRAGAEPELAEAVWRRLRRLLERTSGAPARLVDEEAAHRLEARAPAAAAALRRGAAALAQRGPGQLLAVTRAAADVEAALRHPASSPAGSLLPRQPAGSHRRRLQEGGSQVKRLLALLPALFLLAGCPSFTTMGTARTLPERRGQLFVSPGYMRLTSFQREAGSHGAISVGLPTVEIGGRYGVTDRLELGAKAWF